MFNSKQLESLLGHITEMVRIITKEGRVAYANDAFDRKVAENNPTVGQRCFEVFNQDEECGFCPVRDSFETGMSRQLTRTHNGRIYLTNISPIINDSGEVEAVIEILRDMTLDYNIKQTLMAQNAKMRNDLQLAKNMQRALVKNILPAVPGYDLYSAFFPSEAVGGDMFDCLMLGNKMVMYVADVSGHGVMPAMLGVFFSRAVKTACSLGILAPSEILNFVQKEYEALKLDDSIYITAFLVVLNTFDGSFLYSNAGLSVVPVIYDGKITELQMSSLPISTWFEHPGFDDAESGLKPGGRLLIYSDGVSGIHRDKSVVPKLYSMFGQEPFSAKEFTDELSSNLHTKQEDDFTMLICSRDKSDIQP